MSTPSSPLRLITLGRLALVDADGRPIASADLAKPLSVLAFLLAARGRQASRDRLIDLFWADSPGQRARASLRQTLLRLRGVLGPGALAAEGAELVRVVGEIRSDREEFLAALDNGRPDEAIELYNGQFLPEVVSAGSAGFEHWVDLEQHTLKARFLDAIEESARHALGAGNPRRARELVNRGQGQDSLDQRLWRIRLEAESLTNAAHRVAGSIAELRQHLTHNDAEVEPRTAELIARLEAPVLSPVDEGDEAPIQGELVGRSVQFAALYRRWLSARNAHAVSIHISAGPGLGKSRLLADFASRIAGDRARIARIRVAPGQRQMPWSAAAELARQLSKLSGAPAVSPASAAILVELAPSLGGTFSNAPARLISDNDERSRSRTGALHDLLGSVLHDGPVAILLDDLHWWDKASLTAVSTIIAQHDEASLLVISASRPPGSGFGKDVLALEPLSEEDVQGLLTSLNASEVALPEKLSGNVWRATGGSPLLIVEAIRLAISNGVVTQADGLLDFGSATDFFGTLKADSILHHRVARLPANQQRIARLAATLGSTIRPEEVGHLGTTACNALERDGILMPAPDGLVIAHDRLAEVITDSMTEEERVLSHVDAAKVLRLQGDVHGEAHHIAQSGSIAELHDLARRWTRRQRELGDRRKASEVLADLVPAVSPATMREMVSALPWNLRRPGNSRVHVLWGAAALLLVTVVWMTLSGTTPQPLELTFDVLTATEAGIRHERISLESKYEAGGPAAPEVRRRLLNPPEVSKVFSRDGHYHATPLLDESLRVWAVGTLVHDPVGPSELYLERGDSIIPLSPAPGDDIGADISPDGHLVVFHTTRFPKGNGSFDLAIADLTTGKVWPVVISPDIEESAKWSPDGNRIAFVRKSEDRSGDAICWLEVQSGGHQCWPLVNLPPGILLGWVDLRSVYLSDAGTGQVLRMDLTDGSHSTVLHLPEAASCSLSPDRRWLACSSTGQVGRDEIGFTLYDLHRQLRQPVAIEFPEQSRKLEVLWHRPRVDGTQFTLRLESTHLTLMSGRLSHPKVELASTDGTTWPLQSNLLKWESSDSGVATPDGQGLRGGSSGEAMVTATLAAMRSPSLSITTVPDRVQLLHDESWSASLGDLWNRWGEPPVQVIQETGDSARLLIDGDGQFESGIVSKVTGMQRDGFAAEAEIRTPITRAWWQHIAVNIGYRIPGGSEEYLQSVCNIHAPAGEGSFRSRQIDITGQSGISADHLFSGLDWRLRLQVFSDGSCGIAINGVPIHRSSPRQAMNSPLHLQILGQSVGTRITVGRVRLWSGVPDGVDWSRLDSGVPEVAATGSAIDGPFHLPPTAVILPP